MNPTKALTRIANPAELHWHRLRLTLVQIAATYVHLLT